MQLTSPRLRLRPWLLSDARAAFAFYGDAQVSRLIGNGKSVPDVATAEQVLAKFIAHEKEHGFSPWAIEERGTGRILGICGLHTFNEAKEMELGFRILRSEWGKGVATEAGRLSLEFGFSFGKFSPEKICALTDTENHATQRVLEKLGFARIREEPLNEHGRRLFRYEITRGVP